MLHLNFALNLEKLADKLIQELSGKWTDPFDAPVVVFPDPKLEQWFRLRWIGQKGALANLNATTVERFLFDVLVGKDDSKRKLQADMLMHVILAYLTSEDEKGKAHYESLGDDVKRYLTTDGRLDENRLFDFASRMAALFLEYERSRPSGFLRGMPGILEKWGPEKADDFFAGKDGKLKEREAWQRKLYKAVFQEKGADGKTLLEKVFDAEKREYLTIPYLYKDALENTGFRHRRECPVYLFGLSGMGQFYRVIFQKFAERHDVHVFAQNPCMEFWEDVGEHTRTWTSTNAPDGLKFPARPDEGEFDPLQDDVEADVRERENELLRAWGRAGRDNVRLWCLAADYDFDFSSEDSGGETLLRRVQRAVANREPLGNAGRGAGDGSLDVAAAPSRIREVENLHSRICGLLLGGARIEDVLVVCPRIDDYRTAIASVFDQTPEKKGDWTGDAEEYLHLPYVIVDSPARTSLTENAMTNLFAMLERGSVTRPEFFELVRNPAVQAARGIAAEHPDAWAAWAEKTNTYRRRPDGKDDWEALKRRLLLARMSSDEADVGGTPVPPFSDIESADDDSLCRFAECVADLEEWIGQSRDGGIGTPGDLDELRKKLNKWIYMRSAPDWLKGEAFVQKRVEAAFSLLRDQFAAGAKSISRKIARQSLLYAARSTEYSCGNLFVNGVTFMKFAPNRTIPVKHLFFLGADEASFPGTRSRDSLDLRKSRPRWPGDDTPAERNRYAFLCQLMNTSEGFHVSYVNKDLKKDADVYPSSVVRDLERFVGDALSETPIPLDEDRGWGELFTPRSRRNKENRLRLCGRPADDRLDAAGSKGKVKPPEYVSVHDLASFLKDPFVFGANRCLAEGEEKNDELEEFEPLCLTALEQSVVLKKMVLAEFDANARKEADKALKRLESEGRIDGNAAFGRKQKETLEAWADGYRGKLGDLVGNWSVRRCNGKFQDLRIDEAGKEPWHLTGGLDVCDAEKTEDVANFAEIHGGRTGEAAKLRTYVKALAVIAAHAGDAAVAVSGTDVFSDANEPATRRWRCTPAEARAGLQKIYDAAFCVADGATGPYRAEVDVELRDWPGKDQKPSFRGFRDRLYGKNGCWAHFKKKRLFEPLDGVGFDPSRFPMQWLEENERMASLRRFAEVDDARGNAAAKGESLPEDGKR